MAEVEGFEPSNWGIKTLCVTTSLHPIKSIASHPFYGFFLYISEIITVAKPRWVLLYHSHWLLLVTWDFRRWSHRSWLVHSMLHCDRSCFLRLPSLRIGSSLNLSRRIIPMVADMGFEPMTYRLWACRASSAPIRDIVRLVWACHQEAAEICYLGFAESATTDFLTDWHCDGSSQKSNVNRY